MMEAQIETMRGSIASLKGTKPQKKDKKEKKLHKHAPGTSPSKAMGKSAKLSGSGGKKKGKNKPIADDDVLTFEQKRDLSEAIGLLDGSKLERVIQIIHEGVPEIRDVSVWTLSSSRKVLTTFCRAPKRSSLRSTSYRPAS
jgi:hypothetical protein